MFTSFIFAAATSLAAACGTSTTIADDFCHKADDCNALNGSVKECVEDINKALDNSTATERQEAELALNQCLAHAACSEFVSCVRSSVTASSDDDDSAGGGNPGGDGGNGANGEPGPGPDDPSPPPPGPAPSIRGLCPAAGCGTNQ